MIYEILHPVTSTGIVFRPVLYGCDLYEIADVIDPKRTGGVCICNANGYENALLFMNADPDQYKQ